MTIYSYKNYNNKINEATVEFYLDEKVDESTKRGLNVKITTNRLFIRNITNEPKDRQTFYDLLCDPINTVKYGYGVQTKEQVDQDVDQWLEGWKNHDVCSGLMVFNKETNDFLGHVMFIHGKVDGEGELAIILDKNHWGKGYGSEMLEVLVHCMSDSIIKENYLISTGPGLIGKPLYTIFATARVDNFGSLSIIQKAGLKYYHQQILYGSERKYFRMDL
ncbi:hypothetical protein RB653_010511 [Dictyostelium firmibasis]|uniref:N-acetyltransferase domain-containing protein n=1 Tax=Dictyostelium firmibasis TaxID=79012 RepID=A0AAN7YL45_9MYCE